MIFNGYYAVGNDTIGHSWVVDGYKKRTITTRRMIHYSDGSSGTETRISTDVFNHVNWGWNGKSNGWYYDGIFDTSRCFELDANASVISQIRNFNINIIYWVPRLE